MKYLNLAVVSLILKKMTLDGILKQISLKIADGSMLKLIKQTLKVGIASKEGLKALEVGVAQGSVCSPLLANVYLHYALDEWFYDEVVLSPKRRASLIGFCDDFVMVFEDYRDCVRVQRVLAARMGRFALTLHEEKTRLIDFRFKRPQIFTNAQATTFNFLGFTHVWGKPRKGGEYNAPVYSKRSLR